MPKVQLPKTAKGWAIILVSSMIGFIAGTASLAWMGKKFR